MMQLVRFGSKVVYLILLFYIVLFIPSLFGKYPLVIISGSMEPTLKVGGLTYYKRIDTNSFKKGDILVYKMNDNIISHRIYDISNNEFITKGDNNQSIDNVNVLKSQVLGKCNDFSIPFLGYFANFIYLHKYLIIIFIGLTIISYICEKSNEKNKIINNNC